MKTRAAATGRTVASIIEDAIRMAPSERTSVPEPLSPLPVHGGSGTLPGVDLTNSAEVTPGPRHWRLFTDLCSATEARGNLGPEAYLAAIAIEAGATWVSADRGFSRFRALRLQHPLEGEG